MDILILIIICIGLIIHRHLSVYWEAGTLSYTHGFTFFVMIFTIAYLINFIWIFGIVIGLILSALTFFQIINSAFLWPFLLPGLIKINRRKDLSSLLNSQQPSVWVYGGWTYLIIGLIILTVINFFLGDYSSLTTRILEYLNVNIFMLAIYLVIGLVVGNLLRILTMKFLQSD